MRFTPFLLCLFSVACGSMSPAAVEVRLSAPGADVVVRSTVTLQFIVTGSSSLEVFLDDEPFARLEAPFTLTVDTASLAEGAHRIHASAGAVSSEVRTVTVDRTPPRVVRRAPVATQAPALRTPIEVDFDEPLAPDSVRPDTARLVGPDGVVDASLTRSPDGRRITLVFQGARPSSRLPLTVSVDGVTDLAGNVASADAWAFELLPFQRVALPEARQPDRLLVDAAGAPWVLSTTTSMTQAFDTWREGRWVDARLGVPTAARITDVRVTPEGTLELAALEGPRLLVMTRAANATHWRLESSSDIDGADASLAPRGERAVLLQTARGWRLATFQAGTTSPTLSDALQLSGRPRIVATAGAITLASWDGATLWLHQLLGQSWLATRLPLTDFARPSVFAGRDDRNFRVIGVETSTARLVAFDLMASFGDLSGPGTATRANPWSVAVPPNESVEFADFPSLSRDWLDTGDLGGRGFVVTRNSAFVSVWPFGWDTNRPALFSEPSAVSRVPVAAFASILTDSRWFLSGTSVVHRHGVIVQQFASPRLMTHELYLPNE